MSISMKNGCDEVMKYLHQPTATAKRHTATVKRLPLHLRGKESARVPYSRRTKCRRSAWSASCSASELTATPAVNSPFTVLDSNTAALTSGISVLSVFSSPSMSVIHTATRTRRTRSVTADRSSVHTGALLHGLGEVALALEPAHNVYPPITDRQISAFTSRGDCADRPWMHCSRSSSLIPPWRGLPSATTCTPDMCLSLLLSMLLRSPAASLVRRLISRPELWSPSDSKGRGDPMRA
jgi:hypothetical protein